MDGAEQVSHPHRWENSEGKLQFFPFCFGAWLALAYANILWACTGLSTYSPPPFFLRSPYTETLYSMGIRAKCLHQCSRKGTEQSVRRLRFSSLFYQLPGPQMGKPFPLVQPSSLTLNCRPIVHSECIIICGYVLCFFLAQVICPSLSLLLSFYSVLSLRCTINQEFTVKTQEERSDAFSLGKYLVPRGAGGFLPSWAVATEDFQWRPNNPPSPIDVALWALGAQWPRFGATKTLGTFWRGPWGTQSFGYLSTLPRTAPRTVPSYKDLSLG